MLIRVVLAVNDFILPAGFSEKSLKGALSGEAGRQLFYRESPGVGAGFKPAPTGDFILGGGQFFGHERLVLPASRPGSSPRAGVGVGFRSCFFAGFHLTY